jgi:hypothetical protein
MPALFWLIVGGLAVATVVAVVLPTMNAGAARGPGEAFRARDPFDEPDAPGARPAAGQAGWPPWLGPGVLLAAAIIGSLLLTMLVPGLGGLVLFIPLMLVSRWRRRPPGPRPGAGGRPRG